MDLRLSLRQVKELIQERTSVMLVNAQEWKAGRLAAGNNSKTENSRFQMSVVPKRFVLATEATVVISLLLRHGVNFSIHS